MGATLQEKRLQFIQNDLKHCIKTSKYTYINSNKFFEKLLMNMFEYKNLYLVYNRYIMISSFESNNKFIPFYIFKNSGFKSEDIIKFKLANDDIDHFHFYKTISKIFIIPTVGSIIPADKIIAFKNTYILEKLCKKSIKYNIPYDIYKTYPKNPTLESIYTIPENMLDETAYNLMRINEIKNV